MGPAQDLQEALKLEFQDLWEESKRGKRYRLDFDDKPLTKSNVTVDPPIYQHANVATIHKEPEEARTLVAFPAFRDLGNEGQLCSILREEFPTAKSKILSREQVEEDEMLKDYFKIKYPKNTPEYKWGYPRNMAFVNVKCESDVALVKKIINYRIENEL